MQKLSSIDNTQYVIQDSPPDDLTLDDYMVCYSTGDSIKAIPLSVMKIYSALYDINENTGITYSIIICPFTLMASIFKHKILLTQDVDKCTIVLKYINDNNEATLFNLFSDFAFNLSRIDIQIKTLKNIYSDYLHIKFIHVGKNLKGVPIADTLNDSYYNNTFIPFDLAIQNKLIHPKTLVYVIRYKSMRDNTSKTTVIIPKNASSNNISGYDMHTAGYTNYLKKYSEKINEKSGIVFPVLWFAYNIFLNNASIVYLH